MPLNEMKVEPGTSIGVDVPSTSRKPWDPLLSVNDPTMWILFQAGGAHALLEFADRRVHSVDGAPAKR